MDVITDIERSEERDLEAVKWFTTLMHKKLRKNKCKQDWLEYDESYILRRLNEELDELKDALFKQRSSASIEEAMLECADVANFAMMMAEKLKANL